MSDVKTLIDEYAGENRALRATITELQAVIVLLVSQYGAKTKGGAIECKVPAAARKTAKSIGNIQPRWSSPGDITKGSLRVVATIRKATEDE